MTPRERAVAWAAGVANDPRAVVLDTETLGKKPDAGLCDIAVVAMSGQVVFDSLVFPGRPIPPEATAIHGIRDIDVFESPTFFMVYPDLAAVLTGRRVVVYNAAFDSAVLDDCCDRFDLPALGGASWECAMLKYADFDGTPNPKKGRPGPRWWKLGEACALMGVELSGAHRARADADACRRLVLAMARAGDAAESAEQAALFAMGTERRPVRDWTR